MAIWYRTKTGHVRVQKYDSVLKKNVVLPRAQIKHLDSQTDHTIQYYVDQLDPKPILKFQDDQLNHHVDRWCEYLKTRGLNPATIRIREKALLETIIPFYLQQEPPVKDPTQWAGKSVHLLNHYIELGLLTANIQNHNTALKGFWKWMREEEIIPSFIPDLRLRTPVVKLNPTPLKFTLTPERVLSYAQAAQTPQLSFLALAGFFFSLRPQETMALTRMDFKGGSGCMELECAKVMAKHNLYSKLAVNISKQNSQTLKDKRATPKANSRGWVACFDERAAKLMVELVKKLVSSEALDEPLVKWNVDYSFKTWSKLGIPGITLKDLRRASLYWLGHYSGLNLIEIKNHARHAQAKTTELYLRRPEEAPQELDDLDLDA